MKGSGIFAVLTGLLLAYSGLRLIGLAIKRATHRCGVPRTCGWR